MKGGRDGTRAATVVANSTALDHETAYVVAVALFERWLPG